MDIYDVVGKENTDKIVFESLYGSFPNMSMPEAATVVLTAAENLFGATYFFEIEAILNERINGQCNMTSIKRIIPIELCENFRMVIFINLNYLFTHHNRTRIKIMLQVQWKVLQLRNRCELLP